MEDELSKSFTPILPRPSFDEISDETLVLKITAK
jgi:hypothetical protein